MKINILFLVIVFGVFFKLKAQTGINTVSPNSSSALEINATDKGFMITRVALTSRSDVTTVSAPPKGMLVIATQTSAMTITDNDKVTQGILYKFNGEQWEEIIEEEVPSVGIISPEIIAYAYNNNEELLIPVNDPNTGLPNNGSFYWNTKNFNLTEFKKYRTGIQIHSDGSITADRQGYYIWSINLVFFIKNTANTTGNANHNYALGNIMPGNITYAFKVAPDDVTHEDNPFSLTGSVYLEENERSEPFYWRLINQAGNLIIPKQNDKVGKHSVIWQYAGK